MAMEMPPPSADAGVTTIDCLKDDNIEEVLLRLPSSASLTRAALACTSWRRIASDADFLRRFRRRHPTPHILGLFASKGHGGGVPTGIPIFHLAGHVRPDPDIAAVTRRGDFLLARLEDDPWWRLRDCRNGRLLLSRDSTRSLSVYDPISLRCTTVRRPQDDSSDAYIFDCLVCGGDGSASSFRVVSVQQIGNRTLRAVEYDSSTLEWRFHPWSTDDNIPEPPDHLMMLRRRRAMPMQAAGLIFWSYHEGDCLLLLDTATMKFSVLPLPASLVTASGRTATGPLGQSSYAVGETAYGACCLACIDTVRDMFQVWVLTEDSAAGGGGRTWELEKEMDVRELVVQRRQGYITCCWVSVDSVAAGVAIVAVRCYLEESYSEQFAVDLMDLSIKATFLCCELGCPLQLPWPPLGLAPAAYSTDCHEKNRKKRKSNDPLPGDDVRLASRSALRICKNHV